MTPVAINSFATTSVSQRLKSHDLRPRSNRRQLPAGAGANEDQERARRRLFECFEQAICAGDSEMIGIIDNRYFTPTEKRSHSKSVAQAFLIAMFSIANKQLDRQRRLIRRQADDIKIRMIAGSKHPARFANAAGV